MTISTASFLDFSRVSCVKKSLFPLIQFPTPDENTGMIATP